MTHPDPVQSRLAVPDAALLALLGSRDESLRMAEELLDADVHVRGNELTLTGAPADVAFAERVFTELITLAERGQQVSADAVRRTVEMLGAGQGRQGESPAEVLSLDILSRRGRTIRPKTLNQKRYVDAIDAHTIVFGIGPAGTGKTYLAMAKAVQALQAKQVNRIILTRPAVEAGERLGFLPGTLYEKIDPYLRPLYDALHDMLDPESIPKLMAAGTIEVAPLAYMRGRAQPVDAPGAHPGRLPPDRRRCGSATWSSGPTASRRRCSASTRRVRRTSTGSPPRTAPRRCACGEHLWTVRHRRRQATWQAVRGCSDAGDDRQPAARRTLAGSSFRCSPRRSQFPSQAVPMDPVRARAAARRRLPDRVDHPVVRDRRPGAGRRARAARSRHRACVARATSTTS